ncbi:O-antigen ligase family protein [Atopomonas sediminilitoris]|uniref:O-antigen ligase family protein n=1 Tax=Atopomonas sediminilitoris TaxID=2919919 RepID=UPI001F4DE711|nr:O-antigen ligase family protein [Atopomonas sediminilitoris]MCJ8170310.1 O-antigen ligase family protein [Atopomonas sediminilitoris]
MSLEVRNERLSAWLLFLLFLGFAWFEFGLVLTSNNKLYQQGLVLLFWLPSFFLLVDCFWKGEFSNCYFALFFVFLMLLFWAVLSLWWTGAVEQFREFKRVLYVGLFVFLCFVFGLRRSEWIPSLLLMLSLGAYGIMLSSLLVFFFDGGDYLSRRLTPLGGYSHPILGGYALIALSLYFLMWVYLKSRTAVVAAFVVALIFVFATQSRGLIGAYVFSLICLLFWFGGRKLLQCVGLLLLLFASIFWDELVARGGSYRVEIFSVGLSMISQSPWLGLGLGSSYDISGGESGLVFDNVHNLVLHFAIELGLVGAALWCMLWLLVLRTALTLRATTEGVWLSILWLFSSVACLTDVAYSWETPAAEWFVSWWPVGAAFMLQGGARAARDSRPVRKAA